MKQPSTYRTEPWAIWGFVLAFVFWPAGLVLSAVAVRRIRRSGDQGFGLAVAGVALSVIAALASVVGLLFASGQIEEWQSGAQAQREDLDNEVLVDRELSVFDDLEAVHERQGTWPTALDGMGRGFAQGYRTGDGVCVEARVGRVWAARTAEGTERQTTCAELGFPDTLQHAADLENGVGDEAAIAAQVEAFRTSGEALAGQSTVRPMPDPSELWSGAPLTPLDQRELAACAAMTANADAATDPGSRLALAQVVDEYVGNVVDGRDGALQNVALNLVPSARTPDVTTYDETLALGRWMCWAKGFDPPGDEVPDAPASH